MRHVPLRTGAATFANFFYDDKVIVKFNNPLRTSPDNSQGFSFSHKKVYRTINEKSIEMEMEYAV